MSSVNFDVSSIAFVIYLLNGVSFSNFVLIRDYCTHVARIDLLMLQLCGPFQWRIQKILVGVDDKNFKHKTSKIWMCCNQVRSQKFAMERLF